MTNRSMKNSREALRSAGALSTVGLSFVLALVMGFWIGNRLDAWLHTGPVLTILGFFLGLAAGVLNVFRTVSQAFPPGTTPPARDSADGAPPAELPPATPVDEDGQREQ
ncbi:MAG: AtpZ/AtpI family protein [Acidobacteria bacterium]|nr:AtpZ/AtpI family protein [Acidobacteriota bacterium]